MNASPIGACSNDSMGKHRRFHEVFRVRLDEAGSTAVEFALLAPLYIFLLMGMSAYGIYFGASHSVQQLAADAARAAVAGLDAGEREALAESFIEHNAAGYAFIDPARLTVRVGPGSGGAGQFDVIVSFDASRLPVWGLFERLPMPDQTIERRSTIRIGGL